MLYRFFSQNTFLRIIWENNSFVIFSTFLQVSTSTGVISHFVNAQVVVPEAFILGSGELHVDMGSAINLVCIIEKVSVLMLYYWLVCVMHVWHSPFIMSGLFVWENMRIYSKGFPDCKMQLKIVINFIILPSSCWF